MQYNNKWQYKTDESIKDFKKGFYIGNIKIDFKKILFGIGLIALISWLTYNYIIKQPNSNPNNKVQSQQKTQKELKKDKKALNQTVQKLIKQFNNKLNLEFDKKINGDGKLVWLKFKCNVDDESVVKYLKQTDMPTNKIKKLIQSKKERFNLWRKTLNESCQKANYILTNHGLAIYQNPTYYVSDLYPWQQFQKLKKYLKLNQEKEDNIKKLKKFTMIKELLDYKISVNILKNDDKRKLVEEAWWDIKQEIKNADNLSSKDKTILESIDSIMQTYLQASKK